MGKNLGRRFNREEVELGLRTLAFFSGNTRRASEALREHGLDVAHQTLHVWRAESHADLYAQIYEGELPNASKRAAQRFEEIAEDAADTAALYVEQAREQIGYVPARDLAGAARNLMVTAGTSKDKGQIIRGQPTAIVHNDNADALIRKLTAGGILLSETVDGTVEEWPLEPTEGDGNGAIPDP